MSDSYHFMYNREGELTMKHVSIINDQLCITFPYDASTVEQVRTLAGRKWNADAKMWNAPTSLQNVEKLQKFGFVLDQSIAEWKKGTVSKQEVKTIETIPGLQRELYPFQKYGVSFLQSRSGRALLADEMGLGKTAQALAWLQLNPKVRPVVIVCIASLKLNWEREIQMWLPSGTTVQIVSGKKSTSRGVSLSSDIMIVNYEILQSWVESIRKRKVRCVIIDEAHAIKNPRTIRTKAVKDLTNGIPHVLALTGTPIVNKPVEAFPLLNILAPKTFPSFWHYAQRYCNAQNSRFGWDFSGASNTAELHTLLTSTVMLRRKKQDVLKELPPKVKTVVPMELKNRKEYDEVEKDLIEYLRDIDPERAERAKKAEVLVKIEVLKQLSIAGKMTGCIEWIENYLQQNGKLVVFTTHTRTIDTLMEKFRGIAVKVDGSVTGINRQKAVDEFQTNGNVKLFVGNIKAAGMGITLTVASSICFLEYSYVPGDHIQAEDRIHRIGQTNSVNIYYLVARNSIEEMLVRLLNKKSQTIERILDGKPVGEGSVFSQLVKELSGKRNPEPKSA